MATKKAGSVTPNPKQPTERKRPKVLTDARMAQLQEMKPQARFGVSGYVMMPHSFFTVMLKKLPPGSAAAIIAIGYIIDRTIGANNRSWAKISAGQLARNSGMTAQSFTVALEDAWARGLIERRETSEARGGWEYCCFPEAWEKVPDWEKTDAPPAEIQAAADEDGAADPETKAAAIAAGQQVVQSGKSGRAFRIAGASVQVEGAEKPAPLQVKPHNEDPEVPLQFRASLDAAGVLNVFFRRGSKADHQIHLVVDGAKSLSSQQNSDFKSYVSLVCIKYFEKAADPALIANVAKACGSATIDEYANLVEKRLRRRSPHHTPGLLIELAKDAARTHAERERVKPADDAPVEYDHSAFLDRMRAEYGNPAAIADLRAVNPELADELFGTAIGA